MAEKILLELRDKDMVKVHLPKKSENKSGFWAKLERNTFDQIKSSLVNMGYREYDVDRELKDVPLWYETIDQILPYVIKKLS